MKRALKLIAASCLLVLTACATMAGASIGAGIGSISGNTSAGALIGGGVGAMIDVID
ncbi:MAG: glycine zipper domain-containing protein [Gammaproteobacteria bacterium]